MFTFQVIRLTSVVVYMKWFRNKWKRRGQEAAAPRPVCSCLGVVAWRLTLFGFLSVPTASSRNQWGEDGQEGNHHPSSLLWVGRGCGGGAGKGTAEPTVPGGHWDVLQPVVALSVELYKTLEGAPSTFWASLPGSSWKALPTSPPLTLKTGRAFRFWG